ncbi:hypothetical protein BFG52_07420 [Acinetobacter larvae]|uniref:DUF4222 domain-containing protein n=1 Tax=Acinetobacter larvae TaxID=1789224 RepID=A0A1B2LZ39_9GAMM|nr:hypothetical protein BFG52_07420 [Acinetobacter larvae]
MTKTDFKVGDLVVAINGDDRVFTFSSYMTDGRVLLKCKHGRSYCYSKHWFRPATAEEVAANRRLGVTNESE